MQHKASIGIANTYSHKYILNKSAMTKNQEQTCTSKPTIHLSLQIYIQISSVQDSGMYIHVNLETDIIPTSPLLI